MPHPDPIRDRARKLKNERRFNAYVRSLVRYHPLKRGFDWSDRAYLWTLPRPE